MNRFLLLYFIFLITGCASFPVPSLKGGASCNNQLGLKPKEIVLSLLNPKDVISETGRPDVEAYRKPSAKYLHYNENAILDTSCFKMVQDIEQTKEKGKIYFELTWYFPNRGAAHPFLLFSILSLGIIPSWTQITTELRVVEYKEGIGEIELGKFSHDRYQVLSILIAPVGIYRVLTAPSGVTANEMAQINVNKFLYEKAIKDLSQKNYLN